MKVITIKQPWASLIVNGYKKYEFRTWKTNFRGEILIHAGKSIDKKRLKDFEEYNLEYPTGCIIGKARLTDCLEVNDEFRKQVVPQNTNVYKGIAQKKDWNGYGFKLEDVEKIEPIEINGKLGFWNYDHLED